jgi:hypothetical protein
VIHFEGVQPLGRGLLPNPHDTSLSRYIVITKEDSTGITANFITPARAPVINTWQVLTYEQKDSLTVHWNIDFRLGWLPWEKFASLLPEKSYGPAMEQGLARFKKLVEN